jgi:multidrug efflux pump subunit AcrA (membrane-fusion protein)
VSAPEALAGELRRGEVVRFTVPAFPSEAFTARVDAVGAGLDPDTRTLPVRAVIANSSRGASSGRLKPEMLATVSVAAGAALPAVLLPDDAVQLLDGMPSVFLVRPDGKGGARFTVRPVEIGARSNGRVAITRGLAAGDLVVTVGAFRIKAQIQTGSMSNKDM